MNNRAHSCRGPPLAPPNRDPGGVPSKPGFRTAPRGSRRTASRATATSAPGLLEQPPFLPSVPAPSCKPSLSQTPVPTVPDNSDQPSSEVSVAPGQMGCQVRGKPGMGGRRLAWARWGWASLRMPVSTPVGWRRLGAEPGSQEYASWPWASTKALPSRWGWGGSSRELQVRTLVLLVFSAQLASVTFHHCRLPFGSLPCVFL